MEHMLEKLKRQAATLLGTLSLCHKDGRQEHFQESSVSLSQEILAKTKGHFEGG
jgi:hypothetical protein